MANKQFHIGKQSLGQGAFGHVYRGTMMHENQEIDVAIKRVTNDGDIYEDIKKECDLLDAVQDHGNVIKLLGLEKDENFIYVIMELGDCGDLDHFLMSGEPSLEDKISIMHGTASAMAYMHNLPTPIIHMDIKPGNIIIMKALGGVFAKVCDFGFARIFKPKLGVQYMSTKTGATSWYRAPELFAYDRKKYDASIDTFALGLVYLVVINFNDEDKSLDPNPTQLREGALLQYGQHMNLAKQNAEKMPELFTLSADDIWPLAELKSVVTQMTSFYPRDRIKMADVEVVLRCIEKKTTTAGAITVLDKEVDDLKSQLSDVLQQRDEELQQKNEEMRKMEKKLKKAEEILEKDELIDDLKPVASEKHQRTQKLESNLATRRKYVTQKSQSSAMTTLQRENEENRQLLKSQELEFDALHSQLAAQLQVKYEEIHQKDKLIRKLRYRTSEKDKDIQEAESTTRHKSVSQQAEPSTRHRTEARRKELLQEVSSLKSFRFTHGNLRQLVKGKRECLKEFQIKQDCYRMCYVNNSIYLPCPGDNSMLVYSLNGECITHINLGIYYPIVVHPLSEGRLVLAAESGLYVVDYEGRVMCQIMEGHYHDVHVSGQLLTVIENNAVNDRGDESGHSDESGDESSDRDTRADTHKSGWVDQSDRIHILSTTAPYLQKAIFSVGHRSALRVLLNGDTSTVCVSDGDEDHITIYTLSGWQISQAGGRGFKQPGELCGPRLCATDSSGQVLICDLGNDRQLLSAGGKWEVLPGMQVTRPRDAFIHDNKIYILHGFDRYAISIFKV